MYWYLGMPLYYDRELQQWEFFEDEPVSYAKIVEERNALHANAEVPFDTIILVEDMLDTISTCHFALEKAKETAKLG